MRAIARFVSGRRTAWVTLAGVLVAVGAMFALLPTGSTTSFPSAGLPASSQAAQVTELLKKFPGADQTAAVLVWNRGTSALTAADRTAISARVTALAAVSSTPRAVVPQFSDDGKVALTVVPLKAATVNADVAKSASALRDVASTGLPSGLTARLSGAVGFQADISNAFAGADFKLLLVTALVVAALLIITYRSPVLWIVPLAVVGAADGLARVVVGALASGFDITVDASTSGIQSVLVFGAGTNYALLLIARYREELLHHEDRHVAMATAVRSAGPTIAASGGTVAISLVTLLLGELAGDRALGFACAIGIVIAILAAELALPAALVIFGRGLFWPFVPRFTPDAVAVHSPGFWEGLGRRVAVRPGRVAIVAVVVIGALSTGLVGFKFGLSQTEQLLGNPESVQAQSLIDTSFPAGLTSQTVALAPDAGAASAVSIAKSVAGVDTVRTSTSANGRTEIAITLKSAPQSAGAFAAIRTLRADLAKSAGPASRTLVGGTDATALDQRDAAVRDQNLVVPLILAIVFVILALLLRSLVAPVLLIASVLATFFSSLGLGNLLFQHVLGFPAFNTNVPLFAFLFLVALGIDYNIFLTTRAREERARRGTREGMIAALGATGAVITSAGILLAAVFAVLGVLPVVALAQIGTIVGIGVLLDTLVIRTVLVPALVFLTGDPFWWPSAPRNSGDFEKLRRDSALGAQKVEIS